MTGKYTVDTCNKYNVYDILLPADYFPLLPLLKPVGCKEQSTEGSQVYVLTERSDV